MLGGALVRRVLRRRASRTGKTKSGHKAKWKREGALVYFLNVPPLGPQLVAAYDRDGWLGLQVTLARRAIGTIDGRTLKALVFDPEGQTLPALRAGIYAWKEAADDLLDKLDALLEAALFARAKWAIARCEHSRPHPARRAGRRVPPLFQGAHWYIRPNRGRRPLACPPAREAAKKYRARHAPSQSTTRRS